MSTGQWVNSDMAQQFAREGFHSLTLYLTVEGAAQLIYFVTRAFGAEVTVRMTRPDGSVHHAEVRIGDSVVEIADSSATFPPTPAALHVYVDDADATYQRALDAGGVAAHDPIDQFYGDREATVRDVCGNRWYIATRKGGAAKPLPAGMRCVTPYLHPRGAARLIEFLKAAFDGEVVEYVEKPDGAVAHAKVRIGDSILEMGESHEGWIPMPGALHLYVPDADATYERALKAGATSLMAPADQYYGDRSGAVMDGWGNRWYISTRIRA
jgi:PhnB protein